VNTLLIKIDICAAFCTFRLQVLRIVNGFWLTGNQFYRFDSIVLIT
jgi:hypothetical protein